MDMQPGEKEREDSAGAKTQIVAGRRAPHARLIDITRLVVCYRARTDSIKEPARRLFHRFNGSTLDESESRYRSRETGVKGVLLLLLP